MDLWVHRVLLDRRVIEVKWVHAERKEIKDRWV